MRPKMMWAAVAIGLSLVGVAGLVAGVAWAQKPALKVAALLPGSINDNAFNAMAYKALQSFKQRWGVEVTYQESVPQAEFEGAFRDLAKKGYDVIWGHGFQFSDAAKKVASQFPNSKFVVTETFVTQDPNLASVQSHLGQLGFYAGSLAGLLTKSNVVGVVGAIPIPVITEYMENFEVGAKYVNPKVKVLKGYNGSLFDPASGKQAAMAMIDQGADVTSAQGNENMLGVIAAAKERKTLHIGAIDDQWEVSPETVVVSAMMDYTIGVGNVVKQIIDGKWQVKNNVMTLAPGSGLRFSPFHNFEGKIPKATLDRVEKIRQELVAGKIKLVPRPKAQ